MILRFKKHDLIFQKTFFNAPDLEQNSLTFFFELILIKRKNYIITKDPILISLLYTLMLIKNPFLIYFS